MKYLDRKTISASSPSLKMKTLRERNGVFGASEMGGRKFSEGMGAGQFMKDEGGEEREDTVGVELMDKEITKKLIDEPKM